MSQPDTPTGNPAPATKLSFDSVQCEPSSLIGDHWLEMTATLSTSRSEDFAAWMDRQLAAAEEALSDYASPRSITSGR